MDSSTNPEGRFRPSGQWARFAWLPIPLLIFAMVALWVANPRAAWPFPPLFWLANYGPAVLGLGFIVIPIARYFVVRGQLSVLMLSCGILIMQIGVVAGAVGFARDLNTFFTIYNTAVLLSALCHIAGVGITFQPRIHPGHRGAWLAAVYAGGLAIMGMVILGAFTGKLPAFFIVGLGGTLLRNLVLGSAVALFVLTAALFRYANRRSRSSFSHWYELGLVLLAAGLSGTMVIHIGDSPLQWVTRFTQDLGIVYICVAVHGVVRKRGADSIPMEGVKGAWQEPEFLAYFHRHTTLGWTLRYALAVALVAGALGTQLTLTSWFGPGLPTYILAYPAVAVAAILGGLGPAVVATVLSGILLDYWLLPPIGQFAIASPMDRLGLVIFICMGLSLSLGLELFNRYREKAAAYDRQEGMRASETRYKQLFDMITEGFSLDEILFDEAGRPYDLRYLAVNPAFERHTGLKAADLVGRTTLELFPQAEPLWFEFYGKVARTGEPSTMEAWFGPLGRCFQVSAFRAEPGVCGVVFFDITELKMAENHLEEARQEAEQRARDAEEGKRTLDAIGNSTPDAIFVKDLEGRLLYANAGLLRAVSMTADQVLGRLDTEWLLDPEEGKVVMANDRQVIESGQTQVVEEIVTDAQGPHTWLSTKSPLLNSDGEVSGLVGVARDITDSRRLEVALKQSERLYRAIGESIDYGIWVCASDGQNTYASESFLKMVGLTQEQCSRFGWGTVLHPDDRERTIAAWQECVRTGAAWDMEHRFRGVDGQWHHVLARGLPVRDEQGRITSWAGINLDIDRLKQMEDGLKEEAIRKDDFLALLGHELRNPLVPIGNAVYLMRKVGKDPALLDNACIIIEHQLAHLTRLVDDLLDVSRIARGKIMLKNEAVDLVEIMQGVIQVYQPVFHENDLALEVSLPSKPIRIDADKARIIQVVSNLLYNSIKFTDPGGHVRLSLDVKDCEWSQMRVKDDGAGIPPELLTTIFEPFMQRRETIGRTRGGLGLGLAMAKGLVELHGGHISAHSDGPGKGAEFTVRLPLVKIVDRSEQPASAVGIIERIRGRRILVVDDVVDAAATMKLMLELWGHTVEVAYEGKTALEKAKTFSPEVILCDIGLPGDLDGYSVARAIRKTPGADGVYMIAMTGFGSEGAKDRSQQAGFDSHMTKPVEPEALEQMLARLPDIRSE